MLFSLVKIVLLLIFVTKTASTDLRQEQSILTQLVYYDCGSWIVYESLIQNMLLANGMYLDKIALPFKELLYDLHANYWKIKFPEGLSKPKPIHNIKPASTFYVIIDNTSKIIDVVTEMKNGHYIKCKRVDNYTLEPPDIGQNDYGYECGHEIFSHKIVQMSADLSRTENNRNKKYLFPYRGPLYWPESDYFIYPLSREMNPQYAAKNPESIYFVVLSPTGQIIDVVAELRRGDFIQCARTAKVPPNTESDEDLRLGY
ncbi:hypothetical protein EPUL_005899, partial [Erysiphe pulchra]